MRIQVEREQFLQELEAVFPGLSTRDVIEQSSCFIYSKGEIVTYNGEIACHRSTSLTSLKGAIQASPLLNILRKMREDTLTLKTNEGELVIIGKKKRAGIRMESEIMLPVDDLEHPKKWKKLHSKFNDAINLVHQCTGKDENKFWTTCVHIHPEFIEASDNDQISRYTFPTGVRKSILVRGASIKHLITLGMNEFSETKTWIHFRNSDGLIFSCLRFIQDFPNLNPYLKVKGSKTSLPKGLGEATQKAEIFSAENPESNRILVELGPDRLRIKGTGASGWYWERKKIAYDGPEINFLIAPNLLAELSKRYGKCSISPKALKVNGSRFEYVASLGDPNEKETEHEEEEENDDE